MSSGEPRRVSHKDIQLVQNLIERCLQLYMNQKEVVDTLMKEATIEPGFTELVWQKLEEENREFFKAYHLRLMVKNQILIFNKLLEKQVELMRQICPPGVASLPVSNGSRTSSLNQASACYVPEHTIAPARLENRHHGIGPNAPNAFISDASSVCRNMHVTDDVPAHTRRIDVSASILSTQNSQMGMVPGMNGMVIKSEPGYSNNSTFSFGTETNVLETRSALGDASITTFSSTESNSHPLNGLLENDVSSFGLLGQIPRNFSLSDLTADFSQSADILENYSRSPFLGTDAEDFLNSPGNGDCQGGNKRLDTISEDLSYEEFGSE
ncbi:PREDICTED: uncharacterized protein LOC104606032 [Nelumbo nucifera]|uniref:Uncharacterized protein LOC104606032 n=2 Tax=Nelumbo nucifera TaxID=4432 RepID=A0A1U8B0J2_NELNU|nr:PREDICTED: uncharacterized protein LOC104606032 [Nelumbo nucifera]XP_010269346.1 PREDICTED: uncharacterized protein LOC104606032 [Nelumbo nucifera]DAD29366.1 TPA_asm: hypothetical protein HUJ06_030834 [Nelumbo nucifera]